MRVEVELFGIARERAESAKVVSSGECLGDILQDLARRFPKLGQTCIDGNQFRPGFIANFGGDRFVSDSNTPLADGDTILILSLDAGG